MFLFCLTVLTNLLNNIAEKNVLTYYMVYLKKGTENDFARTESYFDVIFSVISKCFMHFAHTVSMPYRSNAKLQLIFFLIYRQSCNTVSRPKKQLDCSKSKLDAPIFFL